MKGHLRALSITAPSPSLQADGATGGPPNQQTPPLNAHPCHEIPDEELHAAGCYARGRDRWPLGSEAHVGLGTTSHW